MSYPYRCSSFIPWHRNSSDVADGCGGGGGDEDGRREYGEPEANATVAGSLEEEFAAVPRPRMLQQRGCLTVATTPAPATTTSPASSLSSPNMFPQQYCLRWKYHHSNLQTMFSQLLERQAYCDVTLACEGKTLRAHKVSGASLRRTDFLSLLLQTRLEKPRRRASQSITLWILLSFNVILFSKVGIEIRFCRAAE